MTAALTPEMLDAIDARAKAATCEPWFATEDARGTAVFDRTRRITLCRATTVSSNAHADAAFIAHARTDVPLLTAEVRRLTTLLERVRRNVPDYLAALDAEVPDAG